MRAVALVLLIVALSACGPAVGDRYENREGHIGAVLCVGTWRQCEPGVLEAHSQNEAVFDVLEDAFSETDSHSPAPNVDSPGLEVVAVNVPNPLGAGDDAGVIRPGYVAVVPADRFRTVWSPIE